MQTSIDTQGDKTFHVPADMGQGNYGSAADSLYFTCGVVAPTAAFTVDNSNPNVGNTINFTDLSVNTPSSWSWFKKAPSDLSYILFSHSQNPSLFINENGSWDIKLVVANCAGWNDNDQPGYLLVGGVAPPVAAFTVNDTGPINGDTVNFTDLSGNSPTSWLWKKKAPSDGSLVTFSILQNPTLLINEVGFWQIELTATNAFGSDTDTSSPKYIICSAVPISPVADFFVSNTTPPINETVNFTDTSSGPPTSWLWEKKGPFDLGYTTFSTSQNPSLLFTDQGLWSIKLTATNVGGSDTETKTNYVNVGPPVLVFSVFGHVNSIPPGLSDFFIVVSGCATPLTPGQVESILLDIDHPAMQELTIVMANPAANNNYSMQYLGSGITGNKYSNTKFLRGAVPIITSGSAPYSGNWAQTGFGDTFDNWTGNSNGIWHLQINNTGGTTGTMIKCIIEFNF